MKKYSKDGKIYLHPLNIFSYKYMCVCVCVCVYKSGIHITHFITLCFLFHHR